MEWPATGEQHINLNNDYTYVTNVATATSGTGYYVPTDKKYRSSESLELLKLLEEKMAELNRVQTLYDELVILYRREQVKTEELNIELEKIHYRSDILDL